MTFEEEMVAARIRVRGMDDFDGDSAQSRHEAYQTINVRSKLAMTINTVWCALDAGLRNPEQGAQYDALVMLEDLTGRTERKCQ